VRLFLLSRLVTGYENASRYSFDIKQNGNAYEVGIDAQTGAVLEHKIEGLNPD